MGNKSVKNQQVEKSLRNLAAFYEITSDWNWQKPLAKKIGHGFRDSRLATWILRENIPEKEIANIEEWTGRDKSTWMEYIAEDAINSAPPTPQETITILRDTQAVFEGELNTGQLNEDADRVTKVIEIFAHGSEATKSMLRNKIDGVTTIERLNRLEADMQEIKEMLKAFSPPGSTVSGG